MGILRSLQNFVILVAQFLVQLGALNWGLMGLNKTDAIVVFFPRSTVRFIHLAVGVAALFLLLQKFL